MREGFSCDRCIWPIYVSFFWGLWDLWDLWEFFRTGCYDSGACSDSFVVVSRSCLWLLVEFWYILLFTFRILKGRYKGLEYLVPRDGKLRGRSSRSKRHRCFFWLSCLSSMSFDCCSGHLPCVILLRWWNLAKTLPHSDDVVAVRLAVVIPIYKIFRLSCTDFSLIELFTSFFVFQSYLYIHVY